MWAGTKSWIPNETQNLLSSAKRKLANWATVQSVMSLAQVRCLWYLCFKSGLTQGMQLTPCDSPLKFLNGLRFTILSRLWLSLLFVHLFSTTLERKLQFNFPLMCLDIALFFNDLFCFILHEQGVNDLCFPCSLEVVVKGKTNSLDSQSNKAHKHPPINHQYFWSFERLKAVKGAMF